MTLLHHAVEQAYQKGKIERFFRTVRLRFLSVLKKDDLVHIDLLNEKFSFWLQNDYQKRPHDGIAGEAPLDFFLKQADRVELVTDLAEFNKKLLLSVNRTVKKDATISFGGNLYETEMFLAGERLDVKYDPDSKAGINELLLYRGDQPLGVARLINFTDNSKRKRSGGAKAGGTAITAKFENTDQNDTDIKQKENTISYSDAMGGEAPCSRNTLA